MTKRKCAIIGCGFFAQIHLHAWKMIDEVDIVALCDTDENKAQNYAKQFHISSTFNNIDDLIQNETLDFVDIITQPHTHCELVKKAAAANLNIICQKPLAPSLEEANEMVECCNKVGIQFMVHENFRWQTPMRETKHASNEIGNLFFGRIHFRSGYDVYANQPYLAEDPNFIIYDLGVHLLDLARFFMGDVDSIYCHTQSINPKVRGEDVSTILLKMKSGASCIVEASYASHPEEEIFPQTQIFLEGINGSVTLGPYYQMTKVINGKLTKNNVPPITYEWYSPPGIPVQESVYNIQKHWVECLLDKRKLETSGQDNLKTLELVFGAYESAKTGQPYIVRSI